MALRVEPGGEYRGELYIFCDAHPTVGHNNSWPRGEVFDGTSVTELQAFLAGHADCAASRTREQ